MSHFPHSFGTAGDGQVTSGLCVLPLNIVNQKFYTLFWIWISMLQFVTCLGLTLRLIIIFSSEMRDFLLTYVYGVKNFNVSNNQL